MDIAAFLAARLDEDAAVARAAAVRASRYPGDRWEVGGTVYREDYEFVAINTPPPEVVEIAGAGFDGTGGIHGERFAEHIARHDPARVLAETAAKRAILELHGGALVPASCCAREMEGYSVIEWYDARTDPCPTLRALAAPYAEHPDFKPEWRIDA